MNRSLHNALKRMLLVMTVAAAVIFSTAIAQAWWGPGQGMGSWDPQEAYLDEYGFLDPYGPTPSDIRRLHRDQWKSMMGYPVSYQNMGPYGPRPSDLRQQYHRKTMRAWGYPY
jgi:hypothetical protein